MLQSVQSNNSSSDKRAGIMNKNERKNVLLKPICRKYILRKTFQSHLQWTEDLVDATIDS